MKLKKFKQKGVSMTIRTLASKIAKLEGKKSQARIGDIREILGILSDLMWEEYISGSFAQTSIDFLLLEIGNKRAAKKPKVRKTTKGKTK
jgi:hypothetical protein